MKVPLIDLSAQYRRIRREALKEVRRVCDSQSYILGSCVAAIEKAMAEYSGARYAVGVASGSDALRLSLMAAGVGPGDRVVTTPYTFFATAGSVSVLGAVPVFVDIEPDTYNIDPDALEELLKSAKGRGRVKAVIPVHLYGRCADMARVKRVARQWGLKVIEDAAQAVGAEYRSQRAGSIGDTGCFSFYPSKNLGCFGDGGMVTTNNARTARRLRMLRVHGSPSRYVHTIVGTNSRLDELQAAVLMVKMKYLEGWTEKRIANALRYERLFKGAGLVGTVTPPASGAMGRQVFNQYVVRARKRDRLRQYLSKGGIGTEVYYPVPLHLQKCFADLGYTRGDFPEAEKAARETLALPVCPELKVPAQRYVVTRIKKFYAG
jgi:dTDP-4-amino-4,6-dideoxygalactose transaminase